MTDTIFTTIRGSRLYGLSHDASDTDIYEVTTSLRARARQTFDTETRIDKVSVGFDTFLIRVHEGSHQALEALFSPYKVWNPEYEYLRPLIESYRVCGPSVFAKYERTIKTLCYGDKKRRQHAVRLWFNLLDLRKCGRFDPGMSLNQIAQLEYLARHYEGVELARVLGVS
ncbi:MAG: hypothetical protein M0R66_02110 [Candidatus Omnitrophica bacterium]|nr:hypothetical protein [Candidatus Omnitrophota bacterium]